MKRFLCVFGLAAVLGGCGGGGGKERLAAFVEDQNNRNLHGIPAKCPHCSTGWGFVLEEEDNFATINCI